MDEAPDSRLAALARRGDRQAFGALVVRYLAMAERIATRVVRDRDLGRELAQEAMLQAYLSLDRLRMTRDSRAGCTALCSTFAKAI